MSSILIQPHRKASAFAPRRAHFLLFALTCRTLFDRLARYVADTNTRRAERRIARYLATTGGRFSDEIEREMERRWYNRAR